MPWVRIDDQLPQHPKIVRVGALGMALQIAALCYCNRYLTDGFVPKQVVKHLLNDSFSESLADDMVAVGLWEKTEDGYSIHDYLEYQGSKEQILHQRAQKQASGQAGGQASAKARGQASPQAESKQNPSITPTPTPNLKEDTPNGVSKKAQEPRFEELPKAPLKGEGSSKTSNKRRKPLIYKVIGANDLLSMFSEEERIQIEQRFSGVDLEWEAGKCVEWHNTRGGSGNWKLALRNWLDNWLKDRERSSNGRNVQPGASASRDKGPPEHVWGSLTERTRQQGERIARGEV